MQDRGALLCKITVDYYYMGWYKYRKYKMHFQEHNHFVNEGLLEGMRDYKREWGITIGNEVLPEGMRDYYHKKIRWCWTGVDILPQNKLYITMFI